MSTTYHIACDHCKEEYWYGQKSQDFPLRVYDPARMAEFLIKHSQGDCNYRLTSGYDDTIVEYKEWEGR